MSERFFDKNNGYEDNDLARNLDPAHKKIWDEMFVCLDEIQTIVGRTPILTGNPLHYFFDANVAAYLLTKAFDYDDPSSVPFDVLDRSDIDPAIMNFARKARIDENWNQLSSLTKRHQKNIFILVSLLEVHSDDSQNMPSEILDISATLLDVQEGERFADLCCGTGFMVRRIAESVSNTTIFGFEKNSDALAIAKIWAEYSTSNNIINLEESGIFELNEQHGITRTYDKIYANYPFGIRVKELHMGKEFYERALARMPAFSKATSSDWLFALKIMDLLADNGKAVCIMTNGSTWNRLDTPIRQYFVENGFIECVIALPAKLSAAWSIPISLVVLSHGNQGVRLVDASEQFVAERRINTLSDENVENILDWTQKDSGESIFASLDSLRENDYVLNAGRYLHRDEEVKDGIAFDNVIKRITRGAPLKAEELDKISSQTPTNMQYLMLSNIQNGLIDRELPYLSRIEDKFEKYCISNRCLILSKNGKPYKVAVAEHEDGNMILANGNLFIIEVNEDIADPYYLAAYFNSDLGISALNSITVGATIPNIGVESLKKLIIPLPSLEIQHQIGERYKTARDEIALLQMKLEKAKDRMAKAFREE